MLTQLGSTRVIGNWQPETKFLEAVTAGWIGEANHGVSETLKTMLPENFDEIGTLLSHTLVVRPPRENTSIALEPDSSNAAHRWHVDCGNSEQYFIVWSNVAPTELQFHDGRELVAGDGDVILVNNTEVRHRMPRPIPNNRWFVRMRIVLK